MLYKLLQFLSILCFFLNGSLDDIFASRIVIKEDMNIVTYRRTFRDPQQDAALVIVDRMLLGKIQPHTAYPSLISHI